MQAANGQMTDPYQFLDHYAHGEVRAYLTEPNRLHKYGSADCKRLAGKVDKIPADYLYLAQALENGVHWGYYIMERDGQLGTGTWPAPALWQRDFEILRIHIEELGQKLAPGQVATKGSQLAGPMQSDLTKPQSERHNDLFSKQLSLLHVMMADQMESAYAMTSQVQSQAAAASILEASRGLKALQDAVMEQASLQLHSKRAPMSIWLVLRAYDAKQEDLCDIGIMFSPGSRYNASSTIVHVERIANNGNCKDFVVQMRNFKVNKEWGGSRNKVFWLAHVAEDAVKVSTHHAIFVHIKAALEILQARSSVPAKKPDKWFCLNLCREGMRFAVAKRGYHVNVVNTFTGLKNYLREKRGTRPSTETYPENLANVR
jgi:hypothetical protein